MCTLFRLFASVLALSGPIWAQAQTPSAGSPRTPVAALASASPSDTDHRVWLDVVVTDKSGNAVPSLVERDFTLLDNKQPRKIASFQATEGTSRATDPALQVIFVLDGVNTGVQAVMYGRAQLSKFLRQDDGKLSVPTSLVILTDQSPQIQATPTRDGKALADSLDSNQTGLRTLGRSTGAYGAEERRTLSLRTLDGLAHYEATQPGRKLIIWLSPGWAILSWPDGVASEKNEQGLFRTIVALSQELREARITLYSLDPSGMNDANGKFYYLSFLKGVPSYQDAQNGNLALQVLATQSGGRVLSVGNDLGKEITSCLEDTKAFDSLSFESPPADHPDEYHDLEVQIDKPGLRARTRTAYYAEPYARQSLSAKSDEIEVPSVAPPEPSPPIPFKVPDSKIPNFASYPLTDLQQTVRELAGLKPSTDPTGLPALLNQVGAKILETVRGTPDLISHETVASKYGATSTRQQFSYLVLPHLQPGGRTAFDEFRVNLASGRKFQMEDIQRALVSRRPAGDASFVPRLVERLPAPGGPPLAQGFANMWIYFDPLNQPESSFRYLGQQKISGHDTLVLAFSQKPESVRSPAMFDFGDKTLPIFMQGVAWVDASNFKIVRLRTDLLLPVEGLDVRQLTADIEFAQTLIAELKLPLWLPRQVSVTWNLNGQIIREKHHYSDYRLFRTHSKILLNR